MVHSDVWSGAFRIPILYYHSIGYAHSQWSKRHLTFEFPLFQAQMEYLAKHCTSISLKEAWQIRNGQKTPVRNPAVITFDDGYLDNWIWAFPVLKKHGLKATIFVGPEFADSNAGLRPNLEDVWQGKAVRTDLNKRGFLSWEEMHAMEASGLVSIESHTMSHTKYFISDRLTGFHHPGSDCVYPVGNLFPERKPYYIGDPEFERLLPYGYPFFEMTSSVIARKVIINPEFNDAVVAAFDETDWSRPYDFQTMWKKAYSVIDSFRQRNAIVAGVETEEEYWRRLKYEICESKRVLEERLDKKVEFLCWPHGHNNEIAHQMAMESGYLATTVGKSSANPAAPDRFGRIGAPKARNSKCMSRLKLHHKLMSFRGEQPWSFIEEIYRAAAKRHLA